MLLIAACEQVAAVGHCDIIVIIMALRVACSVKRGIAWVADRSGGQAFLGIQVVGGIALEILVGELAAGTAETVQDRGVHLKIREFARIVQTVVNNARDARTFIIVLRFALDKRGDSDNVVHGTAELIGSVCDLRVIARCEVIEHLIDRIDDRAVALVDLIGIREQITLEPSFLDRLLVLQEVMLERVLVEYLVERICGADMVVKQKLAHLCDRVTLGNRDLKRIRRRRIGQLVDDLTVVHARVKLVLTGKHIVGRVALDGEIRLEYRTVIDNSLLVQIFCQISELCVLGNIELLHGVVLDECKDVVCSKDRCKRNDKRRADDRDDIDHRAGAAAVLMSSAAAALAADFLIFLIIVLIVIHNLPRNLPTGSADHIQNDFCRKCDSEYQNPRISHKKPQIVETGALGEMRHRVAYKHSLRSTHGQVQEQQQAKQIAGEKVVPDSERCIDIGHPHGDRQIKTSCQMRDNSRPHAVENIGDISKGTAGSESTDCAERIALKQRKCKTGRRQAEVPTPFS